MRSPSYAIRILIVEDTLSLLRLYSHVLSHAGYIVFEATTSQAARTQLLSDPPDIVLLDRVLPDGDGNDICTWIKSSPDLAQIYVIMLSAYKVTEDDRISGLEAGADDYMIKPVTKRELLARVKVAARLKSTQLALQASEAKHRTLAENSPDLILRLDREGLPTYVNERIRDLFHLSPEAFLALTYHEMGLDQAFMERWYAGCAAVVSTGRQQILGLTVNYHDQTRYFDARLVPEFDIDGRVSSILAVLRDFTERVRTEEAIARLAAVVQQATDAVIIADPLGRVQYVNYAFLRLAGLAAPPEGSAAAELLGPETLGAAFRQVCAEQTPWDGVAALRRPDGRLVDVEAAIFPITDRDEKTTSVAAIIGDLTDRRRSEREREVMLTIASALRKASTRADVIHAILTQTIELLGVESAALVSFNLDEHTAFLEQVIGRHADMTGLTLPDEHDLGRRMLSEGEIYRNNDVQAGFSPDLVAQLTGLTAVLGVPMLVGQRGIGAIWIGSNDPITDHMQGILAAVADMAANTLHRVSLFEELERHAADLEQRVYERTHELADANQRLLELDRLKSKFVSNVSHELRTPISNLKLYMSLLNRGKPEKRTHYVAMLHASVERLGQLVEDILNLSRLEIAHYQPRELAPTDLNAVISQIVAMHQPEAESAGLQLVFDAGGNLPLIQGDFNQLSQLVTNLVINALHYTPRGQVRVKTDLVQDSKCVCLSVEDTGIGIMPEDVPHIFERFYRGSHRQEGEIPGTGLGLAIVKEIVDIHHGEISLESQPDVGTCIRVLLPLSDAGGD